MDNKKAKAIKRLCFILLFLFLVSSFSLGFRDDVFKRSVPGPDEIMNEYFYYAAGRPDCKPIYASHSGFDGYFIIGVLDCPSDAIDEIIDDSRREEQIEVNPEDCDSDANCGDLIFRPILEDPLYHRAGLPEWLPSTYEGAWTIYDVEVEPHVEGYSHWCTLYFHENTAKLYFYAGHYEIPGT